MKRALILTLLAAVAATAAPRDGQHDFDFNIGTWKTHIRRLQHPLSGSTSWYEIDGTVSVRKIWDGRANLEEIDAALPSGGRFQGLTLRLYDPRSRQWNLSWSNADDGMLMKPNYGGFENGRGVFYDQESYDGRTILVRQIYSDITPHSYHFEQSFSADQGRTWEPNFIADLNRTSAEPAAETVSAGRNRDFDFHFGRWKTHVSRLQQPLTGSKTWVEYDGTSDVAPVWNGRASLFQLDVAGPAGRIEGMGLRLFNPQTHEWSLNWANSRENTVGVPMIGAFRNGRGEFLDQELYDGRAILVRNTFSDITPDGSRFEQAFSADGGKTWETNWIMTWSRQK
jgi:hypothetical protein